MCSREHTSAAYLSIKALTHINDVNQQRCHIDLLLSKLKQYSYTDQIIPKETTKMEPSPTPLGYFNRLP